MAGVLPFSRWTADCLSRPPEAGSTHLWLARAAAGLAAGGKVSREACGAFLRCACELWVSHRAVPEREIEGALRLAYDTPRDPKRKPGVAWPALDALERAGAAQAAPLFDGVTDTGVTAAEALQGLFGDGELVCCGWICERPLVRPCREWLPRAPSLQFVVANPMKALKGLTKEGKPSARCQDNVAERRYVVAEFDDAAFGKPEQARVASALAAALPLVMAVDSGGKSLHCWFDCRGRPGRDAAEFFAAAVKLGADRTRWDASGWVRMPGGTRRDASGAVKRQKIVYWKGGGHAGPGQD